MRKERKTRPRWDEYFMFNALWIATRSSCQHLQTGAVIVKDRRIIAAGYNGAGPGIPNCREIGCRKEDCGVAFDDKGKAVCRGVHAEVNAMAERSKEELKGAVMYTVYSPCSSCAKEIQVRKLSEVVYLTHYNEPDSLTKETFEKAQIYLTQFPLDQYSDFLKSNFERIRQIAHNIK